MAGRQGQKDQLYLNGERSSGQDVRTQNGARPPRRQLPRYEGGERRERAG